MKRILSMLLIAVLALTAVPALAANDAGTNYTLSTEGVVVLQDIADRNITPAEGALDVNPVIEGQSPTTGMPVSGDSLYMPMLVQISNPEGSVKVDGKNVTAAGRRTARALGRPVRGYRVRGHPLSLRPDPYHLPVQRQLCRGSAPERRPRAFGPYRPRAAARGVAGRHRVCRRPAP